MVSAVTTRAVTWKYLTDPDSALILARLVREIGVLSAARNITLSDRSTLPVATIARVPEGEAVAILHTLGNQMRLRAPDHRISTLQDLESGRALEIEETLGYAVRDAVRLNLRLPLLECFYRMVRGIDRIRR